MTKEEITIEAIIKWMDERIPLDVDYSKEGNTYQAYIGGEKWGDEYYSSKDFILFLQKMSECF